MLYWKEWGIQNYRLNNGTLGHEHSSIDVLIKKGRVKRRKWEVEMIA